MGTVRLGFEWVRIEELRVNIPCGPNVSSHPWSRQESDWFIVFRVGCKSNCVDAGVRNHMVARNW